MAKQFIVRLKSGGKILANSQIITVKGLGEGAISAKDFTDGSLRGTLTTKDGVGTISKVIAGSGWDLDVNNTRVQGGSTIKLNWTAQNNSASLISWFAVFPGTTDIFSGLSLDNVGSINNLVINGNSGSFEIDTDTVGREEKIEILLYNGSLSDGLPLARSDTITILPIDFTAKLTNTVISEGQPVLVEVRGAPFENVTFRGETNGSFVLDKSGFYTGSITPLVSLSSGRYKWVLDGDKTNNVVTLDLTVRGTSFIVAQLAQSIVANGSPIAVSVTGVAGDTVTVTRNDNAQPSRIKIPDSAGSSTATAVVDDIRRGVNTPAGTYTYTFDGEVTQGLANVTVEVRNYTLAVTPPTSSVTAGRPISVLVSGAPNEIITITRYPGMLSTAQLDASGSRSLDLTGGITLDPGEYTWTFDGSATANTPTHVSVVGQSTQLRANYNGPTGVRRGQPIVVSVSGADGELVTFTGNTSGSLTLNGFGLGAIDVTQSTSMAIASHTWTFTGDKSSGTPIITANVIAQSNLYVTGNTTFVEQDPINLSVFGANFEIITARVANKLPITFALDVTGTKTADISPMNFPASNYNYTVNFSGSNDPSYVFPFSFNVTPKYLLAVTGPQPSVQSGDPIVVTITGAPAEVVNSLFGSVPGPSLTLTTVGAGTTATGSGTVDLAAGITLAPSTTPYVWTFTGNKSKNTVWPTYSVRVNSPYTLSVVADNYNPPAGTAVNVTVSGSPGEIINYTGSVSNGSITLSNPSTGPGVYTFNILAGVATLSPGPYSWTFTGTAPRTNNTTTLAITVGVAIPTITSFSRNSSDGRYYWVAAGTSIARHLVRATLNSVTFNTSTAITIYDLYSTNTSLGPVSLEAGISSGTTVTFRLNVYNVQGGVSLPSDLTITVP